jgi:hypothetical protein
MLIDTSKGRSDDEPRRSTWWFQWKALPEVFMSVRNPPTGLWLALGVVAMYPR